MVSFDYARCVRAIRAAGNSAVTIMACILSRSVRRVARILLSVTTRGRLRGNITFGAFSDANWLDPSTRDPLTKPAEIRTPEK